MKFVIIPTGEEIKLGTIIDTNTPAITGLILEACPQAVVCRTAPVSDNIDEIRASIIAQTDADVIIIIGGSGGGKAYDADLAPDLTHVALGTLLECPAVREIYGANGHLWSRLVIGMSGKTLVANVPGPYVEAVAAAQKLIQGIIQGSGIAEISLAMSQAVFALYPAGGRIK